MAGNTSRLVVQFHPSSGRNYTMYPRNIRQSALDALSDSPVVLINGARQTGKSTLVKDLAAQGTLPHLG
jgi:predicted AAA+ superfamily ATPase